MQVMVRSDEIATQAGGLVGIPLFPHFGLRQPPGMRAQPNGKTRGGGRDAPRPCRDRHGKGIIQMQMPADKHSRMLFGQLDRFFRSRLAHQEARAVQNALHVRLQNGVIGRLGEAKIIRDEKDFFCHAIPLRCLEFMAEQVLVTGGTGFIGRPLVRKLMAEGSRVRVFTRQPDLAVELFGSGVDVCTGDLRDADAVLRAVPRGGIIYHLGGLYRFGPQHRRALRESNVEGTRNVLRAAAAQRVNKIVHVSTAGLLYRTGGLIGAADFHRPPAGCHYKRSKWQAEELVLHAAAEGIPVTIASPTCPIGPEDCAPTPTGRMIEDFLARRFVFSCRAGLNLIDVGDLADGLAACAFHGRPGQRYILGRENLSLDRFLGLLQEATGIPAPVRHVPGIILLAAGLLGESLLASAPGSTFCPNLCLETAIFGRRVQHFELEGSWKALQWQPGTCVRTSLRSALDWLAHREIASAPPPVLAPAAT